MRHPADTSPEIAELYHRMLMNRSGDERIQMACEMFQAGRAMVHASLIDQGIQDHSEEMRVEVLRRTYWRDFPPDELETIAQAVRARFHRQAAEDLAI
jgi:hypothetical protein